MDIENQLSRSKIIYVKRRTYNKKKISSIHQNSNYMHVTYVQLHELCRFCPEDNKEMLANPISKYSFTEGRAF